MFTKKDILNIVASTADQFLDETFDSETKNELTNFVAKSISDCILSDDFIKHIERNLGGNI